MPEEHAAWSAARAGSGWRELGAWVRVTVNELFDLPAAERPGRIVERDQVVDVEAYLTLVAVANSLYELVARANAEQRYPAEREATVIYGQVRDAVDEIRAAIAAAARWARVGR